MPRVNADDLTLFAANHGGLYPQHCWYAKAGLPLESWRQHVFAVVHPLYCKEVELAALSPRVLCAVAANLKDYYDAHVKEMN